MSHELTVIWVVGAGTLLAMQPPINGGLGRTLGKLPATFASFMIGLVVLGAICLVAGDLGRFGSIGDATFPTQFPGLIGAIYVATATVTVSRIGAGAVAAATIAGQLTCSLFIDEYGWVGVDPIGITGVRIFGAVLLLVGTVMVVYRKEFLRDVEGAGEAGLASMAAMVLAGALVAFQHPMNAELATHIGGLDAGLMNFFTGTCLLALIVFGLRLGGDLGKITTVRWYYLLGGLIGIVMVLTALTAVETIGAAGLTAAIVTGQLLCSVVLDRVGAFGLDKRLVTPLRLTGIALLGVGTFMVVS